MDPSNKLTLDQLIQRMEERKKVLEDRKEQRKTERENVTAESENADYFYNSFLQMKDQLEYKIENAKEVNSQEMKTYLDSLVADVQKMQVVLNESSMFLASFQIKKAQELIDELNDKVQLCIQELQPKKKFGFKSKREKTEKPKIKKTIDSTDSEVKCDVVDNILEQRTFGFKDMENQTLVKDANELENRQLNLQNLSNCKIIALGNPSTLQVSSLTDCTVIVGPTSRSAFVKNCRNCTFVIACQQLRIHDTFETNFYLHVTGAAIIENCKKVAFAPYNLSYHDLESHYIKSQLNKEVNHWDKIDDFHWLNENIKSPNFSLIDEDNRKSDWL